MSDVVIRDERGHIHLSPLRSRTATRGLTIPVAEIDGVIDALAEIRDKYGPTTWTALLRCEGSLPVTKLMAAAGPDLAAEEARAALAVECGLAVAEIEVLAVFPGRLLNHLEAA